MKQLFAFALSAFILASCGNNKPKDNPVPVSNDTTTKTVAPVENHRPDKINSAIKNDDFETGLALVTQSDCFTCHKMNEKLVGPSFTDIANMYPVKSVTIDTLADKIIAGAVGKWGQVPMLPHTALSKENAKKMMNYVFALKQN